MREKSCIYDPIQALPFLHPQTFLYSYVKHFGNELLIRISRESERAIEQKRKRKKMKTGIEEKSQDNTRHMSTFAPTKHSSSPSTQLPYFTTQTFHQEQPAAQHSACHYQREQDQTA
jgi:hypothetical protein